jgi:hypothetical protein
MNGLTPPVASVPHRAAVRVAGMQRRRTRRVALPAANRLPHRPEPLATNRCCRGLELEVPCRDAYTVAVAVTSIRCAALTGGSGPQWRS